MLRNAAYTIHKGSEYRIFKDRNGKYILVSYNLEDAILNNFVKEDDDDDIYIKEVTSQDVGYVYSIHTFGIYKGHKLRVESEKDNELFLVTSDLEALKACGLEWLDRGFYGISLDKSEVTLFEEKELMPNFFGEND